MDSTKTCELSGDDHYTAIAEILPLMTDRDWSGTGTEPQTPTRSGPVDPFRQISVSERFSRDTTERDLPIPRNEGYDMAP